MIDNPLLYFRNETIPLKVLGGPFRGARIFMNPRHSKRYILGVYEQILNPWLEKVLPTVDAVFDVGANGGYFTYGCAAAFRRHKKSATILAFEPQLVEGLPHLSSPASWGQYDDTTFEFIPLFVGTSPGENTTTLDTAFDERPFLKDKTSLIKVDVEGAEVDVMAGGKSLLASPHHWVVEVHGDHLLEPVLNFFREANRAVEVVRAMPHWLLGKENRTIKTSWVVTKA